MYGHAHVLLASIPLAVVGAGVTRKPHLRSRELHAELELLERYDAMRIRNGYDYGNGARAGELNRRRRELRELRIDATPQPPLTFDELAAAFRRVGHPRDMRAQRDYRKYGSHGAFETARTWRMVRRLYGRPE